MRQKFKFSLFVIFLALCFLTSCKKNEVTSISLDKPNLSILVGGLDTLKATISTTETGNIDQYPVTWESCCPYVVSVDKHGVIKGLAEGTATITARAGGKFTTSTVICKSAVTNITINKPTLTIVVGQSDTLVSTIIVAGDINKFPITWNSSNTGIISVNEYGIITGIADGTATITAYAGDKYTTSTITCKSVVTSIDIVANNLQIIAGLTYKLYADIKGNGDVTKTPLTWSTSDPNVATITTNGIVKGISNGSAIIYLKSGNISDSTIVFVNNKIPINRFGVATYHFYADFRDCGNGNWLITKNCFIGQLLIIETGIPERQNLGITITTSRSADKTMIPDGTYTVDTNNTSGANLQPFSIIPEIFGKSLSWYSTWYSDGYLKIKSGYITVLRTSQTSYDIEYNLIDNYNNTYQGTRKGEIYF